MFRARNMHIFIHLFDPDVRQKLWDGPTNGDATLLLLPYCGWLMYATYLNGGIWWLNKDRVINGGGSGRGFAGLGREKGTAPK